MTLCIVIVSWNSCRHLERCLASLASSRPATPHTITVVDNASSDGTADMVAARFPSVRLIRNSENLGFARGNNVALRADVSELLLLLNPDTIVQAGAIDALVARLIEVPGAVAAGPRIIDADGRAELSFGRMPSPVNELRQKLLTTLHARRVPLVTHLVERMTRRERVVDWVSGACLLVRRQAAEAVGFLDERYRLYWEDVDFCAALRGSGGRVLFTPATTITHLRGRSSTHAPGPAAMAYRQGQLAFYAKHRPKWLPFLRWYVRVRYHEQL
jgi:GT2 family glycosyltransferase